MKLGDLFIKLGLQKGEFDKGIDDAKKKTSMFGSAMGKIGGMIAGAFAVSSIINFGKELLMLSGQAEGVQTAFNKIATSNDLQILRNSTKNTVSDLELMKRAVTANNFGIPVKELGRLFEFASKRAQDTGQSVDYLVDSIVMGIGRKSPLILDNLGISAIQLKEKLGKVSLETASVAQITKAVGDIAEESFKKSGRFADTLGTKIVSLNVKWENFKLSLTTNEGFQDFWKKEIDELDKNLTVFFSKNLTKWEKFKALIDFTGLGNQVNNLYEKAKNSEFVDSFLNLKDTESSGGPLEKTKKIVKENETLKKLIEDIAIKQKELSELPKKSIAYYEAEIALLEQKQKLITDPHLIEQSKTEISIKKDRLDQLTKELKLIERIKMSNKDIGELVTKGLPTKKGYDTSKLVISPEMKANMTASDTAAKLYNDQIDRAKEFTDELNQIIQSGLTNAIESFASGLTELAMGDIGGKEFGAQVLAMVGNFMIQLGIAFITFSKLFIAFQQSIASMNPWAALGIGVALVAAGAVISTVAKKGMSGGASASSPASGYSNFHQSSAQTALTGNVVFELDGYKLKGALNNVDRRNQLIR